MPNQNLNKFFNPESIAIVGATDGEGKVGTAITKNILELGYEGKVFLVNPNKKEIYNQECHPDIQAVKSEIDLAVVVVPAPLVNEIVKKAADKVKNFVIISAGFSEIGGEGKKREEELQKIAEENNLNVLGPNCLGFINPSVKLNATFAGGMPEEGNIGLVSQSGALAAAILDIFAEKRLGFSGVFSVGNKTRIDETNLINYLGENTESKVIGLYLEGIKDGRKFMETAGRISKLKPVVILKAGKTEKAQKAISLHTGALAGSEEIIKAVFEKCGIIEAENLEEFINLLILTSTANPPLNEFAAVVTNAGGAGVLATDAFRDKKIKLAELTESVKEKIKSVLPAAASVENPIDVLGDACEDRYENTLRILGEENIGAFVCVLTPQQQTPAKKISEKIIAFAGDTGKVVASSFIGGKKIKSAVDNMEKNGVPNFSFPEQAVKALEGFYKWNVYKSGRKTGIAAEVNSERKKKTAAIIEKAGTEKREALLFSEAERIMKIYGIKTVETHSAGAGRLVKFPAVVKVDSDKILHKTDKNGIILNVKNKEELARALEKINSLFPGENIIVQPMLERQTELIIGIKRDEIFGSAVVCGLGGIYTEIFNLAGVIIPPFSAGEAEKFLAKSKIGFLFQETRKKKPLNIREIAGILEKVGVLAWENPEIKELDVNPLLTYNDEREATAADVKIIFNF